MGHVAVAAVTQHHRADILGRVSWCLLRQNNPSAVRVLSTWLLMHTHAHVAAEITAMMAVAAGSSTDEHVLGMIAGPLADAVAAAVDSKQPAGVKTVVQAADLMVARGLGGLLRLVNTRLVDVGRADVAAVVLQTAAGLGKLQLMGVLGGELLVHGDVKAGVQIVGETLWQGLGGDGPPGKRV